MPWPYDHVHGCDLGKLWASCGQVVGEFGRRVLVEFYASFSFAAAAAAAPAPAVVALAVTMTTAATIFLRRGGKNADCHFVEFYAKMRPSSCHICFE